jgi:hypothetical protein
VQLGYKVHKDPLVPRDLKVLLDLLEGVQVLLVQPELKDPQVHRVLQDLLVLQVRKVFRVPLV